MDREPAVEAGAKLRVSIRIKDEVWIAVALLQHDHPERADFSSQEIANRVRNENVHGSYRPGVDAHINLHCVANRAPNPARLRYLFATHGTRRRLFRTGDPYHPGRAGKPTCPQPGDVPERYHWLLEWYRREHAAAGPKPADGDSILGLRGLGKDIWADEEPDAYVRRLREGW